MDYYLTITDENGCQYFDTLSVDTLISIIADAGPDTLVCFENSLLLIGSSNIIDYQTYTWYDANGAIVSTDSTLVIDGTISGSTFYVLEIGYAGCSDLDTVFITVAAEVLVDAGLDIDMYTEQSEVIGGSPTTDPTNTVVWTPSIFLNDSILNNPTVIQPTISTWYYVIATDTNGCINIDSIYVAVLPDIVIPDGISPGSDGKNDTWILDFTDQYPGAAIKINVYNRWGDLLFESDENYNDDWGGTTENGKRLPAGTYYYVIDIDHEDFPEPLTGPLTIMW
jgi:gliding motility-associated-like protein